MKMSCYFLVQASRNYFPVSDEENILRVWILDHCDSEDGGDG